MDNPHGLRIDGFEVDTNRVTAPFEPHGHFAGFDGVLHGGIVATALDEISAWAAMLTEDVFVFTAKLNLSYRKQVPTGQPLTLSGTVVERRGRRLSIAATLESDEGTLAESEGIFIVAPSVDTRAGNR
jgi:acyl-coenzyme A thioesterase PaaI-like protein